MSKKIAARRVSRKVDRGAERQREIAEELGLTDDDEPLRRVADVNASDAPRDYDPELGRIKDWKGPALNPEPEPEMTDVERTRVMKLATDLVRRLGPVSALRAVMPVARPPDDAPPPRIDTRLRRALPELEALHRALCAGWRGIVLQWLEQHATAKVEQRYRPAFERDRSRPRVNAMPPREVATGAELLTMLRRNPAELMGEVPQGLSAEMLDCMAGLVTRSGKGAGGRTPTKALAEIERHAANPAAFRADVARDGERRKARRERRQK